MVLVDNARQRLMFLEAYMFGSSMDDYMTRFDSCLFVALVFHFLAF